MKREGDVERIGTSKLQAPAPNPLILSATPVIAATSVHLAIISSTGGRLCADSAYAGALHSSDAVIVAISCGALGTDCTLTVVIMIVAGFFLLLLSATGCVPLATWLFKPWPNTRQPLKLRPPPEPPPLLPPAEPPPPHRRAMHFAACSGIRATAGTTGLASAVSTVGWATPAHYKRRGGGPGPVSAAYVLTDERVPAGRLILSQSALSDAEEQLVDDALAEGGDPREVLTELENVTVRRKDMATLCPVALGLEMKW